MIAALRTIIIATVSSWLFALWSGAIFLAGFGTCYWLAIEMLERAGR